MIRIPDKIKAIIPKDFELPATMNCEELFRLAVYFKEGLELETFAGPVYELAKEIFVHNNRKRSEG